VFVLKRVKAVHRGKYIKKMGERSSMRSEGIFKNKNPPQKKRKKKMVGRLFCQELCRVMGGRGSVLVIRKVMDRRDDSLGGIETLHWSFLKVKRGDELVLTNLKDEGIDP